MTWYYTSLVIDAQNTRIFLGCVLMQYNFIYIALDLHLLVLMYEMHVSVVL